MATGKGGKGRGIDNSEKANDAFDDVDDGGFDLKALIAASKTALAAKQASNTKKKKNVQQTLLQAAQERIRLQSRQIAQLQTQADASKADNKVVANSVAQASSVVTKGSGFTYGGKAQQFLVCRHALDAAEAKIADVLTFSLYTKEIAKDISKLLTLASQGSAYFGPKATVAKDAYNKRVGKVKKALGDLRTSASSSKPKPTPAKDSHRGSAASRFFGMFHHGADGVLSLRGTAKKALAMVGRGIRDKVGAASSKVLGGMARFGHNLLDRNPRVAKAVEWVGSKVNAVAVNVKDASKEAYGWISKKMSFLGSMLGGFLRKHNIGANSSTLGSLLGLAALIPTIIAPALEGINAELEKRFGKTYIQDFMLGLWSKAWGFLTDKVKQLLGISDSKQDEHRATAANALANPNAENTAAYNKSLPAALDEKFENSKSFRNPGGDPQLSWEAKMARDNPVRQESLTTTGDKLRGAIQQQKDEKLGSTGIFGFFRNTDTLQRLTDAAPPGSIDAAMAKDLKALGVRVGNISSGKPTNARVSISATSASAPPMDGAVTATPPSSSSGGSAGAGRGTGGAGGGVTNAAVPNHVGNEFNTVANLVGNH
jgi:hypothetical protein